MPCNIECQLQRESQQLLSKSIPSTDLGNYRFFLPLMRWGTLIDHVTNFLLSPDGSPRNDHHSQTSISSKVQVISLQQRTRDVGKFHFFYLPDEGQADLVVWCVSLAEM